MDYSIKIAIKTCDFMMVSLIYFGSNEINFRSETYFYRSISISIPIGQWSDPSISLRIKAEEISLVRFFDM